VKVSAVFKTERQTQAAQVLSRLSRENGRGWCGNTTCLQWRDHNLFARQSQQSLHSGLWFS